LNSGIACCRSVQTELLSSSLLRNHLLETNTTSLDKTEKIISVNKVFLSLLLIMLHVKLLLGDKQEERENLILQQIYFLSLSEHGAEVRSTRLFHLSVCPKSRPAASSQI
jgi:hypothetical protein